MEITICPHHPQPPPSAFFRTGGFSTGFSGAALAAAGSGAGAVCAGLAGAGAAVALTSATEQRQWNASHQRESF